jgi:hypothetical protein
MPPSSSAASDDGISENQGYCNASLRRNPARTAQRAVPTKDGVQMHPGEPVRRLCNGHRTQYLFYFAPKPNRQFMWQLFKEFLAFLKQEKKWWLIPLVVVLLLLAALIVFSGGSVLAPLMYPFM